MYGISEGKLTCVNSVVTKSAILFEVTIRDFKACIDK